MTLIQALRSIAKDVRDIQCEGIALLKDSKYGYTLAYQHMCIQYQLRNNPQNVLRIYRNVGGKILKTKAKNH